MKNSPSKERILSKIRSSLAEHKLPIPFPEVANESDDVFVQAVGKSLAEVYAEEFSKLGGRFVYCANHHEMIEQLVTLADNLGWSKIAVRDNSLLSLFEQSTSGLVNAQNTIDESDAAISLCERLVARTGSAVYSSAQAYGRALPVYTPIHITIAYTSQLVWNWTEAQQAIMDKYEGKMPSMLSLTTGPSRTADIEKTLVVGVHGPKEVYTFLVEN